jgi:hypothetical protein
MQAHPVGDHTYDFFRCWQMKTQNHKFTCRRQSLDGSGGGKRTT